MKFNIGSHLQEIDSYAHGIVTSFSNYRNEIWYLLKNDELDLINYWVPESVLELHKQPLREQKLKELGI